MASLSHLAMQKTLKSSTQLSSNLDVTTSLISQQQLKTDVTGGVDIENTAAQVVNYYNPTTKKVEKPNKPTEKRVNSVPVEVEFNFTKTFGRP